MPPLLPLSEFGYPLGHAVQDVPSVRYPVFAVTAAGVLVQLVAVQDVVAPLL